MPLVKKLNEQVIKKFQDKIFNWWKKHKRPFPWRETTDPYKIMVSEFMLQQTQTNRVKYSFEAFIKLYPDMKSLAKAKSSDVLKFWSKNRLGYNRRALWLYEVVSKINTLDYFPRTIEELQKYKGIGSYTSRSILIFAFNKDIATIDTNIRRILISEGFADNSTSDQDLLEIAKKLLPRGKSRDWHNALMDFGALVKTSTKTGIKPRSKQSKFEGSTRQFRGRIVKYLTKNKTADKDVLIKECETPKNKIEKILSSLVKDGLIALNEDENKYTIA